MLLLASVVFYYKRWVSICPLNARPGSPVSNRAPPLGSICRVKRQVTLREIDPADLKFEAVIAWLPTYCLAEASYQNYRGMVQVYLRPSLFRRRPRTGITVFHRESNLYAEDRLLLPREEVPISKGHGKGVSRKASSPSEFPGGRLGPSGAKGAGTSHLATRSEAVHGLTANRYHRRVPSKGVNQAALSLPPGHHLALPAIPGSFSGGAPVMHTPELSPESEELELDMFALNPEPDVTDWEDDDEDELDGSQSQLSGYSHLEANGEYARILRQLREMVEQSKKQHQGKGKAEGAAAAGVVVAAGMTMLPNPVFTPLPPPGASAGFLDVGTPSCSAISGHRSTISIMVGCGPRVTTSSPPAASALRVLCAGLGQERAAVSTFLSLA